MRPAARSFSLVVEARVSPPTPPSVLRTKLRRGSLKMDCIQVCTCSSSHIVISLGKDGDETEEDGAEVPEIDGAEEELDVNGAKELEENGVKEESNVGDAKENLEDNGAEELEEYGIEEDPDDDNAEEEMLEIAGA